MLSRSEYRKQLEEGLEREKIQLDPDVINDWIDLMYECETVLEKK